MEWSFSWNWCKKDLQNIQEENIFLPCVHDCFTSCGREGFVLHVRPESWDECQLHVISLFLPL